jgi:CheY-like chemotaxis protein
MTAEPFRILLVEDNSADVYLFRKALLNASLIFELTVIEDGGRAMSFVRGDAEYSGSPVPDLAIIDLSLPKNDGVQILEAIRAAERFGDMPVIVASSSAWPPARLKAEHLRVARYITKPPDLEDFLHIGTVVREILLQNQARRTGY